ncbi:AGE family epimerase/isomerase [uncultured Brevundimonas sp.]|uniref:AGE family epimerase/isomerase n=1 Tax=uncultured Brevundimonas sp. TaxID=213418 RepID=UPI0026124B14|nr:AGE family epimerase/isomerase [uncultured Brevundimonas sp.]
MSIYPVIMCGGAGTRLWPASRPMRPKQFIALHGEHSLFQATALRAARLLGDGGTLVVVGGADHETFILEQLAEIGLTAQIILEPEGRDSAPAMTAAALWTASVDADAVNVFVASDHYLPDADAFSTAAMTAAKTALTGRIVTLGVTPTSASSAYGYIEPTAEGLSDVARFVEKPDSQTAQVFIDKGLVWNTGIFIARSDVFLAEVRQHVPAVFSAVDQAMSGADGAVIHLPEVFKTAPKVSIDYAVMEKTQLASVLRVDFEWSDLGAWDTVANSVSPDQGRHILIDSPGTVARAPEGVIVTVLGAPNLAVVVENDAVLVCELDRSQDVKSVVERVKQVSPQHLDFQRPEPTDVVALGQQFIDWMKLRALPVWASLGIRENGIFAEAMTIGADPVVANHRVRVQTRQLFTFAEAGRLGWSGPWEWLMDRGLEAFERYYISEEGMLRGLLSPSLDVLTPRASIYDHAFGLFALAAAHRVKGNQGRYAHLANGIRERLFREALPNGGLVETEGHPYQSNAHMHLLEACLAWEEVGGGLEWADASDQLVNLACTTFIDPANGCLREFFDENWQPAPGAQGRRVEPGHQFEWAWLLLRYARRRNASHLVEVARTLYSFGMRGYSSSAGVLVDAIDDEGKRTDCTAKLWPQTEWVKAALVLSELSEGTQKQKYLKDAGLAVAALNKYLTDDGLWHDVLLNGNEFPDEPAKASSLYHIVGACAQLVQSLRSMSHPASLGKSEQRRYT